MEINERFLIKNVHIVKPLRVLEGDLGLENGVITYIGESVQPPAGCRVIDREVGVTVAAEPHNVVNTVGAGDAFTAAFVLHQLAGDDAERCAEMANRAGGFATTQDSGTPVFPDSFRVFYD